MERTHTPAEDDHNPTGRSHPIVDEPATPEACAGDYQAGSGARTVEVKRQRLSRSKARS
ncbi:hypothetical protein [Streptomyces sp. NPDC053048]|uniref:hypothetical protein n=1 Tax=Streptomyces sp. NPDC053048 TaxID=3365694 RepID=UPI0037CDB292